MERSDKDNEVETWFKATAECRTNHNRAFRAPKEPSNPNVRLQIAVSAQSTATPHKPSRTDHIGQQFKMALAKGEVCPDLGAPPVLVEPVVERLKEKSMERLQTRGGLADLERREKLGLKTYYEAKTSGLVKLVQLFSQPLRDEVMAPALKEGKFSCQKTLFPAAQRDPRIDVDLQGAALKLEKKKCGCDQCPCDSAVCLSAAVTAEKSVYRNLGLEPETD